MKLGFRQLAAQKRKNSETLDEVAKETVRLKAYLMWLDRIKHGIQGTPEEDWSNAEREYRTSHHNDAQL